MGQGPCDHVEALLDHLAAGRDDNRDGALGRGVEHLARLVAQHHFAQAARPPRHRNRHPRPHRIGAAPEGVEDGLGHTRRVGRGGAEVKNGENAGIGNYTENTELVYNQHISDSNR